MPEGPGKYDELATLVRRRTRAHGVILIVLGGTKGNGFEVHLHSDTPLQSALTTAQLLRDVADGIERDARARTV